MSWLDSTPAARIGSSSGMGAPSPAMKRTRKIPAYVNRAMRSSSRGQVYTATTSVAAVAASPPRAAPLVVHTEASVGFGGQELRIIAEASWLVGHDWQAGIMREPCSPPDPERRAAAAPLVALAMR